MYVGDASTSIPQWYIHTGQAKIFPDHGGNRTRDLWPMLCQLSYEVKSIRVCDISELRIVPSLSVSFHDNNVLE